MIYWELTDREIDYTCDVISLGLEDASAKAREFARVAYLQLKSKFPKRAEKLKAHLQVPIRAKLTKMEEEHDIVERKKKLQSSSQSLADQDTGDADGVGRALGDDLPVFVLVEPFPKLPICSPPGEYGVFVHACCGCCFSMHVPCYEVHPHLGSFYFF